MPTNSDISGFATVRVFVDDALRENQVVMACAGAIILQDVDLTPRGDGKFNLAIDLTFDRDKLAVIENLEEP